MGQPAPLKAMGIDVSHWQHPKHGPPAIDWQAVKQQGVAYVFVKATDGRDFEDERFAANWAGAESVGLPRGAYHFFRPAVDPLEQARLFLNSVSDDPGELPPVLDLENTAGIDNVTLVQRVDVWLRTVKDRLGKTPIIYTSKSIWDASMLVGGLPPAWTRDYPLWVAQYPFERDTADPKKGPLPPLPSPRSISQFARQLIPTGWATWQFWQYTSRGSLNGLVTPVDQNLFNGPLEAFHEWARLPQGRVPRPVVIPVRPPPPADSTFTNQKMINAFFRAAKELGVGGWDLVLKAGLERMAEPESNRAKAYNGPPVAQMLSLTAEEREVLGASFDEEPEPPTGRFVSWDRHALPGLHGPADPGQGWVESAFEAVQQTKVRAVKVLVPDVQVGEVARLRQMRPDMFVMARLFTAQLHERRPHGQNGPPRATGQWLANEVADPGDANNPMTRATQANIRHFEVHNEPNLTTEGLFVNWNNGAEFAQFFQGVVDTLRPKFPNALFGFPGLSPGPVEPPRLRAASTFLTEAAAAIELADFLCCHVYWGQNGVTLQAAVDQLGDFCARFPRKRILCTEFSNNNPFLDRTAKAAQYAQFFEACRALPSNLGAMFIYALSWRDDKNSEGLLSLDGNGNFVSTGMAAALGALRG